MKTLADAFAAADLAQRGFAAALSVIGLWIWFVAVRDGFVRRRIARVEGEFRGAAAVAVGGLLVFVGFIGLWSAWYLLVHAPAR